MPEEPGYYPEDLRVLHLEEDVLDGLCSDNMIERLKAAQQLPEAMTPEELVHVAVQVSCHPGVNEIRKGEKLERQAIFEIGLLAVISSGDLVTAKNAQRYMLKERMDVVGWAILKLKTHRAEKQILRAIQEGE